MTNEELKQKIVRANSAFYDTATQLLHGNVTGAKNFAKEANDLWHEIAEAATANRNLPIYWVGNLQVFGLDPERRFGNGEAQLEVEVYRRGIKIVVGDKDWLDTVLSRDGIEITEEMRECLRAKGKTTTAYTFAVGNGESVIYSKEKLTIPVLAHELTHAAKTMLEEVGVNDDEAFAYVVEHLMEQAVTCADVVLSPSFSDESRRISSL